MQPVETIWCFFKITNPLGHWTQFVTRGKLEVISGDPATCALPFATTQECELDSKACPKVFSAIVNMGRLVNLEHFYGPSRWTVFWGNGCAFLYSGVFHRLLQLTSDEKSITSETLQEMLFCESKMRLEAGTGGEPPPGAPGEPVGRLQLRWPMVGAPAIYTPNNPHMWPLARR